RFEGDRSGEALRIVRTRFSMTRSAIVDAAIDGMEVAFSTGVLRDGHWQGSATSGLALNVVASRLILRGAQFGAVRSAIEVGDGGRLTARGIDIVGARRGVISRDGARVEIAESRIREGEIGLIAYRH